MSSVVTSGGMHPVHRYPNDSFDMPFGVKQAGPARLMLAASLQVKTPHNLRNNGSPERSLKVSRLIPQADRAVEMRKRIPLTDFNEVPSGARPGFTSKTSLFEQRYIVKDMSAAVQTETAQLQNSSIRREPFHVFGNSSCAGDSTLTLQHRHPRSDTEEEANTDEESSAE